MMCNLGESSNKESIETFGGGERADRSIWRQAEWLGQSEATSKGANTHH